VQRRHNELTPQLQNFPYKKLQTLTIEFRCRIIKEQCRSRLGQVLQEAQLRQGHGHGDQFLLAAREDLPGGSAVQLDGDVGAMRAGVSQTPRLVAGSGAR
jgi:hypothetical protein